MAFFGLKKSNHCQPKDFLQYYGWFCQRTDRTSEVSFMGFGELSGAIILLALLGLGFYCSLAETAIFALKGNHIQRIREKNPKRAESILGFLKSSKETLASLTFFNNAANFGVAATSLCMFLNHYNHHHWVLLSLVVMIVGCEIFPKTVAIRHPEIWSLRVVSILKILTFLTSPFQRKQSQPMPSQKEITDPSAGLTSKLSIDEYQELLELACQQGGMKREEKNLIMRIISLDLKTAKDCMKLRSQIDCVPTNTGYEEMVRFAREHPHRFLPMYDEETNDIQGVVNVRELLSLPSKRMEESIHMLPSVPDSMNLLLLLKNLQSKPIKMFAVRDEFGEFSGILTLEDILEEVIGDIRSEAEEDESYIEQESANTWKVSGTLPVEELLTICPEIKVPEHIQTAAGLLLYTLEILPQPGQSARYGNYQLTAVSVEFARIREIRVTRLAAGIPGKALSRIKKQEAL